MKIAIVGTGISGLVAAHHLQRDHDLTVFEAGDWIGGHTSTVDVPLTEGGSVAVDTGFIVFNERTYPNFVSLLRELGVGWRDSDMGFSVRCERTGLEYSGSGLNGLFAQRSNLLRPSFHRMVRDVLRFYREARDYDASDPDLTLGRYLDSHGYSSEFVEHHMLPMGSAVWSARAETMRAFPMRTLVRFFDNHGFLQLDQRPQWLVVDGGSREYVRMLVAPFRERVRLKTPVRSVERRWDGVRVTTPSGHETFDRVILACHSDQALRLLQEPSPTEREVLGAIRYQRNEVVLHTDDSLLPRRPRARASWNYHLVDPPSALPTVTYWMNRLQGIAGPTDYLVTLNRSDAIDASKVLRSFVYHHPIFDLAAIEAQRRHGEIDGVGGVHYCGAYWGYGFHEDGVNSALAVLERIGEEVSA